MSEDEDIDFEELAKEKYGDKVTGLEEDQFERLEELFYEKHEKFGDERLALTSAIGSFNFEQSSGGEEVTIYVVGSDGPRNFQGDTLFCYGVLDPEGEEETPGRIAIIAPDGSVDQSLLDIKDMFAEPYQAIKANISYRPAKRVEGAYVGEVGSMGEVFSVDDEDGRSFEERKQFVEDHVSVTQIGTISEGMTTTKEGNDWPEAFGADFKQIPYATVLESAVSGKGARYVFQDDSFIEARDLPPEVRGEDDELGLVAYADPDIMALQSESIVDVYGTITPNSDGQPTLDVFGYYGHYENEVEDRPVADESGSGGSSSGSTEVTGEAIDERTI